MGEESSSIGGRPTIAPANLTTALFDSAAKAEAAVDRLVAMGLGRDAVRLIPQHGASAAEAWGALAGLRLPDADRYGYAEAIRRGGVLLALSAATCVDGHVVGVLEAAGAVDLDEREDEWWSGGWRGYRPGAGAKDSTTTTLVEPDPAVGQARLPGDARVRRYRPVGPS